MFAGMIIPSRAKKECKPELLNHFTTARRWRNDEANIPFHEREQ
jgi:hypothetical protein